ncbi:MAG: hypothetical protein JSS54_12935 [Proteobacteria bacterium]|nr:hypothetical protein [Pseudomonadota bacterium]
MAKIVERMLVDAENLSRVVADFSSGNEGLLKVATTHTQARYTLSPVIAE